MLQALIEDDVWEGWNLGPFVQDTTGIEWEGLFYPPTFDWYANLTAARRWDGVDFYQRIRIPGEEGKPLDVSLVEPAVINARALMYINSARHPCSRP